ncbi:MAG: hypothetical protein EA367_14925 [Leptolyngbya sp. DLM2.Bin15]|nr:MAG: hypothetical protein EA367_14925 [Leptolyngbya sp. DLM2.Bin15]
MMSTHLLRPELGDFSSIVCFKAVIVGVEEALGEKTAAIALLAAGRLRGKNLAKDLNLSNTNMPLDQVTILLNKALGKDGTRLCLVDNILEVDETYQVFCRETVCSAGEPQGSNRNLSFTLGAVQGALEEITQKRLRGKQIASVLRGSDHDVIEFGILHS